MLPGTEESYWMHSAPGPVYPRLEGDVEAFVTWYIRRVEAYLGR